AFVLMPVRSGDYDGGLFSLLWGHSLADLVAGISGLVFVCTIIGFAGVLAWKSMSPAAKLVRLIRSRLGTLGFACGGGLCLILLASPFLSYVGDAQSLRMFTKMFIAEAGRAIAAIGMALVAAVLYFLGLRSEWPKADCCWLVAPCSKSGVCSFLLHCR
ncbi:MAG: hypothetical protein ACI8W8_004151, partial [Rhodothermales bacterium]